MIRFQTQDSPRPRVGVKPPPMGAVGGCACQGHERVLDVVSDLIRGLNLADEAPDQVRGGRIA